MKVTDAYNVSLVATQRVRRRRQVDGVEAPAGAAPVGDQVMFSGRGMEVSKARLLALQAPEVRAPLVDSILALIRSGHYQVRGAQVAPKLIQEHLAIVRA